MSNRQELLADFLKEHGFADALMQPIPGDASFRRYIRLIMGESKAMLMDAPPEHEDVRPFTKVARFLTDNGFSAPDIYAEDEENGFLVLEDLGDSIYTKVLNSNKPPKEADLYKDAINVLVELHENTPLLSDLPQYDNDLLSREIGLFTEWYIPSVSKMAADDFFGIWQELFDELKHEEQIVVLRDYHADNLLWLPERKEHKKVGLLDFQDAVIGTPAYDIVSLIEDARRDLETHTDNIVLDHYVKERSGLEKDIFEANYAMLAAQRNTKIVGIFARLCKRDNKWRYNDYLPRVWGHLQKDLEHPLLAPIKSWFDSVTPEQQRGKIPA